MLRTWRSSSPKAKLTSLIGLKQWWNSTAKCRTSCSLTLTSWQESKSMLFETLSSMFNFQLFGCREKRMAPSRAETQSWPCLLSKSERCSTKSLTASTTLSFPSRSPPSAPKLISASTRLVLIPKAKAPSSQECARLTPTEMCPHSTKKSSSSRQEWISSSFAKQCLSDPPTPL